MNFDQKAFRIYCCSLQDQFISTTEVGSAIVAFRAEVPRARAVPLTNPEWLCVQFFKAILLPGRVYSCPRLLMDLLLRDDRPADALAVSGPIVYGTIADALQQPVPDPEPSEFGQLCFFEVLQTQVNRITLADATHVAPRRGLIRIRRMRIVASQNLSVGLQAAGASCQGDVFAWCRPEVLRAALTTVRAWQRKGVKMTVGAKPHRMCDVQRRMQQGLLTAPLAIDDLRMEALEDAPAPTQDREVADDGQLANIEPSEAEQDAALQQLVRAAAFSSNPFETWKSVSDLDRVHADTLLCLARRGLVHQATDDFGLVSFAVNTCEVSLTAQARYDAGVALAKVRRLPAQHAWSELSKIELVAELLAQGWSIVPSPPRAVGQGLPKVVAPDSLNASHWCLLCLAMVEKVMERGVRRIYMGMPAKYYEILLVANDLSRIIEYDEGVQGLTSADFAVLTEHIEMKATCGAVSGAVSITSAGVCIALMAHAYLFDVHSCAMARIFATAGSDVYLFGSYAASLWLGYSRPSGRMLPMRPW